MRSIPLHSLVLMVGPSNHHKERHIKEKFQLHEIESCERVAFDIYGDSSRGGNPESFLREVYHRTEVKLALGERVVIDTPYLAFKDRIAAVNIGLKFGAPTFYIVTEDTGSLAKQSEQFRQMKDEILRGDNVTNVIDMTVEDFNAVHKLPYKGLLDHIINQGYRGLCVVPDVHGMIESLKQAIDWAKARGFFIIFLGDIIDYGPQSIDCVYLVYDLVMRGQAIMTIGNHEKKIERWLVQQRELMYDPRALNSKTPMRLSEGNKATIMLIQGMTPKERARFEGRFAALLAHARHHWVMNDDLMVVHGACEPEMFNIDTIRLHGRYESRALYGEVDAKKPTRVDGYPNRIYDWVDRIPEGKLVLVGHDIRDTVKPMYVRGALGGEVYFLDTGSGKGGRLTTADLIFRDGSLTVQNFTAH